MQPTETTGYEGLPALLRNRAERDLLRFITCGSVDDGKSTLLGRMLYDASLVFEDQIAELKHEANRKGSSQIDYSALLDGLQSERDQGITIDVAYRYFSTEHRNYIIADCPGHEQYTRNMATGASTADLAVILLDARKGVLPQTRRHSYICKLLGVRNFAVAINKMDLVEYSEDVFHGIVRDYDSVCRELNLSNVNYFPVSALKGDNIVSQSASTPWYKGKSLLGFLDSVEVRHAVQSSGNFILPVQKVIRAAPDFRGYAGNIASGSIRPGDEITVLPSRERASIESIAEMSQDGELASLEAAFYPDSVIVTLDRNVDVGRGDFLVYRSTELPFTDSFQAELVWMSTRALKPGDEVILKFRERITSARVEAISGRLNLETFLSEPTDALQVNDIGSCTLRLSRALVMQQYSELPELGQFIVIDRMTEMTVGAGMVRETMVSAGQQIHGERKNLTWHGSSVTGQMRSDLKNHEAFCIWLTGLSGSGKSTLANAIEMELHKMGWHTMLLDGDNVRQGLNRDLGMTAADRTENIRRIGEVARLMVDAGLVVITAFISPFRADRQRVRELFPDRKFIEVFVDAPLEVCSERDPKGLYKKARAGQIRDFTGIDSPYEQPLEPEIHVRTAGQSIEESVSTVLKALIR